MSSILLTIDLAFDKNNLGNDVVPGLWVALLTVLSYQGCDAYWSETACLMSWQWMDLEFVMSC